MGRLALEGEDLRPYGFGDVNVRGPVQWCAADLQALRALGEAVVGFSADLLSQLMTPVLLRLRLRQRVHRDRGIVPSVLLRWHGPRSRGAVQVEAENLLGDRFRVHHGCFESRHRVRGVVGGPRAGLDQVVELCEE